MKAAHLAGASSDEILDAVFIAAIIGQTRVLALALRTFQELEEKEGRSIPSPLVALAQLQDWGQRNVVAQSLHIVPGDEFHQLASLVRGLEGVKGK